MYKKRIDELWKKIREYHRDNNPLVYQEMIKIPPVKDEDFKKIEELIGVALPKEFKYSYMTQNIKSYTNIFGSNMYFFSLEEIYTKSIEDYKYWSKDIISPFISNKIVRPTVGWEREWLYFANIYDDILFMIDLRKDIDKCKECVLEIDMSDWVISLGYISFIDMLEDATSQLLEKGEYDEYPVDDDPTAYR